MTAVNISGTFKKDQRPFNGLEAIADVLLDETQRHRSYFVVAEIRPHAYTFRADDGAKTPTVRFDHIEVASEKDALELRALLTRLYEQRTGSPKQPDLFDEDEPDDGGEEET